MTLQHFDFRGDTPKRPGEKPLTALILENQSGRAEKLVIGKLEGMNNSNPQEPRIKLEDAMVFEKPHQAGDAYSSSQSFVYPQVSTFEGISDFPTLWSEAHVHYNIVVKALEKRTDWVKPCADLFKSDSYDL